MAPTARNTDGRLGDRTFNRALAVVSNRYRYLTVNGHRVGNPAPGLTSRPVNKTLRGVLDVDEVKAFRAWYLDQATRAIQAARPDGGTAARAVAESAALDAALLDLLFFTGLLDRWAHPALRWRHDQSLRSACREVSSKDLMRSRSAAEGGIRSSANGQ
jgi:hypothetical protein